MNPGRLSELRKLCEAATEDTCSSCNGRGWWEGNFGKHPCDDCQEARDARATLAAAACSAVPELLDEIERRRWTTVEHDNMMAALEAEHADELAARAAKLAAAEAERDEALGEISRMTMRPAAEILEAERLRMQALDRMQAERNALAAKLAAMTAARDEACSLLDDAVQLRRDSDEWFPRIAELRAVGVEAQASLQDCQAQRDALAAKIPPGTVIDFGGGHLGTIDERGNIRAPWSQTPVGTVGANSCRACGWAMTWREFPGIAYFTCERCHGPAPAAAKPKIEHEISWLSSRACEYGIRSCVTVHGPVTARAKPPKDEARVAAARAAIAASPVTVGSRWRHQVTDSLYVVAWLSVDEVRLVPLVTYCSETSSYCWTRDLDVFLGPNENGDQRFVPARGA